MQLVTAQDFNQVPYNVPNAFAQSPEGGAEENEQFNSYIDTTVQDIMIKLLGGSLYESFLAGLNALPAAWIGTNSPGYNVDDLVLYNYHVWKSLITPNLNVVPVEGANWTKIEDDRWLMLYNGAMYGGATWGGLKKMLIPYIYSMWLRDTYDEHTKIGVIRRTAENAIVIDPAKRTSRAYNTFSLHAGNYYQQYNSLYGYLIYAQTTWDHYTDYYDSTVYAIFSNYLRHTFKDPGRMNIFNI